MVSMSPTHLCQLCRGLVSEYICATAGSLKLLVLQQVIRTALGGVAACLGVAYCTVELLSVMAIVVIFSVGTGVWGYWSYIRC